MNKYNVKYHLNNDWVVERSIEANKKEIAMALVTNDDIVNFENEGGTLYEFKMSEVKLITVDEARSTVEDYKIPKARKGSSGFSLE